MDDKEIVKLYWNRDERAIHETEKKYGSYCLSIAKNILESNEDAEECVNDSYLHTWNSIPPKKPQMLSTYLGKIVRNLSFNCYKKNKTQKRGGGKLALVLDELSDCISDSYTTEEIWDGKLLTETIGDFLGTLPAGQRKLFVCRYWYADSIKDIADRFGMTETHVSVSLNRIRRKLKTYLLEKGFTL